MRLFSLQLLYKTDSSVTPLASAHDLSSFGFFERKTVKEFMDFTGKLVVERIRGHNCRTQVPEQAYICHCFVRGDKLAGICISDDEYPSRVAQSLLSKVMEDFTDLFPANCWSTLQPYEAQFKQIEAELARYQNPKQADALAKIQGDVDDTKEVMTHTMESLLNRGEKLDDLVARSDALSAQSKAFYQTAKRTRKCCSVL